MKNRTMRLVSCAILSLIVHTGLAATFLYAVKPKPVKLEISNPIHVSLVDDYSSATGSKNDDSISSGLLDNSTDEVTNETDFTQEGNFDLNNVEIQMVAAIDPEDKITTPEPKSAIIEDLEDFQDWDSNGESLFDANLGTNSETEDGLAKNKSELIDSTFEERLSDGKIRETEHAVPARFDDRSNESENEILKSSNNTNPPVSIKPRINVQTAGIYSHLKQEITMRDASVNEKSLAGSDSIEPEFLSHLVGEYQVTTIGDEHAEDTDNANEADYNPVSPDFDSEFIRLAWLDFEINSHTELDNIPDAENTTVDQPLNLEVFRSIGKFEESLTAEIKNSIPDKVLQAEKSQRLSQLASKTDNSERSDTDQLIENSVALSTTQKSTEQSNQQQPSHNDFEPNREPSTNSPPPVHSQMVASIGSASANSSPKYGVKGLPNPAPRYPYLSRANGEEGKVILQVVVDRYGLASEITIVQSSGYRRLDKAARKAVKKWKFHPALKGGIEVQGVVQVPISFVLRNS